MLLLLGIVLAFSKYLNGQNIGNFQKPINQNPYYQQDLQRQQDAYNQQIQQHFQNNPNRPFEYNLYQKPIYQVFNLKKNYFFI